jgi:hypothetical protein
MTRRPATNRAPAGRRLRVPFVIVRWSWFAALIGVSVRTLQGWEQDRKQPSAAARTMLAIAATNPKVVLAVASK